MSYAPRPSAGQALEAQQVLERRVADEASLEHLKRVAPPGMAVRDFVGKWASTPGWAGRDQSGRALRGRWMFTGYVTAHPPVDWITVGGQGGFKGRRVAAPKHLQRERKMPNLVFVSNEKEYVEKLHPPRGADQWIDARDLAPELREMLLDALGPMKGCPCYECQTGRGELTPAVREICAEQIAARAARPGKASPPPAVPAKAKPKGGKKK